MPTKKTKEKAPERHWLSFAFIFVGSVIFLGLAFMASNYLLNGSTSLWQPILYSVAVIGSLVVFIANLVNIMCPHTFSGRTLMKVGIVTGFSLVALTYALVYSQFFSLAVLSFILVLLGTSMCSYCDCGCDCE